MSIFTDSGKSDFVYCSLHRSVVVLSQLKGFRRFPNKNSFTRTRCQIFLKFHRQIEADFIYSEKKYHHSLSINQTLRRATAVGVSRLFSWVDSTIFNNYTDIYTCISIINYAKSKMNTSGSVVFCQRINAQSYEWLILSSLLKPSKELSTVFLVSVYNAYVVPIIVCPIHITTLPSNSRILQTMPICWFVGHCLGSEHHIITIMYSQYS